MSWRDESPDRNKLYGRQWRKYRAHYLSRNPLCVECKRERKFVAATVVDHIKPHRGNHQLFWDVTNHQALCQHHHDSHKQGLEKRGYSTECGDDGWPTDPHHPANR